MAAAATRRRAATSRVTLTPYETLWGGPHGEGLVHTVDKLAGTVAELSDVVRKKADATVQETIEQLRAELQRKADVAHGEDGEPISLRKVYDEIRDLKKWGFGVLVWLALVGVATLLVLGRSLQIAYQGHL